VTRYIWGDQLISSDSESARTYYHYASDEMGSVTHVVEEESRRVRNRYGYDAFGNMEYAEETVRNRFRYTGQQYDSVTGQYYLRARYYNPVIGRFLQEDTYYGDGLNLYAYCRNNPVRYYDPSGHDACPKALHDQMKGQGIPDVEIAQNVERIQALIADENLSIEDAYKKVTGRDYAAGDGTKKKTKAEILAENRANGRAFEVEKVNELKILANGVEEQITIVTKEGRKIRVDAMGYEKVTEKIVIQEYKSSATAPLTTNQFIGFQQIKENGGRVVGKGKGDFTGGFEISAGTDIKVIRP